MEVDLVVLLLMLLLFLTELDLVQDAAEGPDVGGTAESHSVVVVFAVIL